MYDKENSTVIDATTYCKKVSGDRVRYHHRPLPYPLSPLNLNNYSMQK